MAGTGGVTRLQRRRRLGRRAELNYPTGVAVDSADDLFIADQNNQRIREVKSGVITTVVGNGTAGYSGGSGSPTVAELSGPAGVAVSASGNLFVADAGNNRIREVIGSPWITIASGAFFGPGTTGVVWQNQVTGLVAFWEYSGGAKIAQTTPQSASPTTWKLLGTGDLNGDGTTDLVWQNLNTGLVTIWFMNQGNIQSYAYPNSPDLSTWSFLGIGNFAGSAVSDLAWQDVKSSDGQYGLVAIWLMNSSGAVSSITFPQTVPPGTWKMVGIGDFDGSGTADLAWQDQNSSDPQKGLVAMWFMSSSNPGVPSISCVDVAPFPAWSFLGTGNFDNNGTADLAWQDQLQGDPNYGLVSTWEMNTSGVMTGVSFVNTAPPSSWKLLAIADFNGNASGISDIAWQDQNSSDSSYGLVAIWIMDSNGDGQSSKTTFPGAINPSNMQLTVGNAVGTNPPDLIWHNLATGQVLDWRVQSSGTTVQSSVLATV